MGSYTTIEITSAAARRALVNKIFSLDNDTLERWLDELLEPYLRRCRIDMSEETEDDLLHDILSRE